MFHYGSYPATEINNIKEEVKIEIKSLLCSSKQGLSEYELKKEYYMQFGKEIPYSRLGYTNMYDMMRSMPDVCYPMRHSSGNMWIYHGVIDEKIESLARLVRGQKTDKSAVKREQLRAQYKSRYQQPQNYNINNRNYINNNSFALSRENSNSFNRSIPAEVQQQIKHVLSINKKLSLINFENSFVLQYGNSLDFREYGFNSVREMFENLSHLVYIERFNATTPSGSDMVCLLTNEITPSQSNGNVTNLNDSLLTNVSDLNKSETRKKYSKEEEEIKESLTSLLKSAPDKWFNLIELSIQYEKLYKRSIEYEKYGFKGLDKFIFSLELENVRYRHTKLYHQLELKYDENAQEEEDDNNNDEKEYEDIGKLENYIKAAFAKRSKPKMNEFFTLFEKYHGWKLDCKQYGYKTNDEMLTALTDRNLIKPDFGDDNSICFSCEHLYESSQSDQKTSRTPRSDVYQNTKNLKEIDDKERAEYNIAFIQEYIIYNKTITNEEVVKQFAAKKEHEIIVSHVTNPCFIEVQLNENFYELESLMDKLDIKYNGWGSSDFDMPESHLMTNRLCATLYTDNNWHRCQIVELGQDKVLVNYIDYGGDEWQPKNKIKFLFKEFNMPIQAVKAKFAHIRHNQAWKKDNKKIVNYLLSKVSNRILNAKIFGVHNDYLSLDIYDMSNKEKPLYLNEVLVKEGMAEWYDEQKDVQFVAYETWKKILLEDEPRQKNQDNIISKFENALSNFQKNNSKQSDYNNNETDENNNVVNLNKSSLSKQEDASFQDKQLKTKLVVYYNQTEKKIYRLNLVSVNNEIYVHWTQVAFLFGFNRSVFKHLLKMNYNQNYLMSEKLYFKIFVANSEQNQEVFDIVQNDFNIDLDSIQENEEMYMVKFLHLYEIAKDMLDEDYAKKLEDFIIHNKVTGKNVNPQLFEEYKKQLNQLNNGSSSEKSVENSSKVSKVDSSRNSTNEAKTTSIADLSNIISVLKTSLIFYEENKNTVKIEKTKAKISFYEKKLSELYNK